MLLKVDNVYIMQSIYIAINNNTNNHKFTENTAYVTTLCDEDKERQNYSYITKLHDRLW